MITVTAARQRGHQRAGIMTKCMQIHGDANVEHLLNQFTSRQPICKASAVSPKPAIDLCF